MITNIKDNLKTILTEIVEFKKVYGYEPGKEGIPSALPAFTIKTTGMDEVIPSEIAGQDRIYNVIVKAYIKLIDAENTQKDIDNVIDLVLNELQAKPSLDGSCDFFKVTAVDVIHLTDRKNPVSVVNFYLSITEEVNV